MVGDAESGLLSEIYEAAFLCDLWPGVLDRIAALSGSAGTVLFTSDHRQVLRWTSSETILPVIEGFVAGGWSTRNPRDTIVAREVGLAGFGCDRDILSDDEREADPMYTELLKPLGYGWFAGTHILVPSGDVAIFDVERRIESGPMPPAEVARLNALRPHLARAALLATRLGLERARNQVETLAAVGLPAAVLSAAGRVLAVNDLFESSNGQIGIRSADRLCMVNPASEALYGDALDRVASGRSGGVASVPLPGIDGGPAAIAHLVPIRRAARDVFSQAAALLVVTALDGGQSPSVELLTGLFDLTPAEARVARALAQGRTVDEVATSGGVARETVRSQLKAVLAKTGTTRQSELVRLLTRGVLAVPADVRAGLDRIRVARAPEPLAAAGRQKRLARAGASPKG